MLQPRIQQKIFGWLRAGKVRALHLGMPCTSFARARDCQLGPPPVRSDLLPLGLPDLCREDQLKVQSGNALMRFSGKLLNLCCALLVPGTLENPASSRLWLCKPIAYVLRRRPATSIICDFCQFGTRWRRPAQFAGVHIDLARLSKHRCRPPRCGFCSRTGELHIPLVGRHASGKWMKHIAEPYPRTLASALAQAFLECEVKNRAMNFERHICQ